MRVDADYAAKPYEEWAARDWPRTYQSPAYREHLRGRDRVRAAACDLAAVRDPERRAGCAGAAADGDAVGDDRKAVARSIVDMIRGARADPLRLDGRDGRRVRRLGGREPVHRHRGLDDRLPDRPDFERYPEYGRDLRRTFGEIGLAGHWIKILLHHLFLYKAKLRPGWRLIPE